MKEKDSRASAAGHELRIFNDDLNLQDDAIKKQLKSDLHNAIMSEGVRSS